MKQKYYKLNTCAGHGWEDLKTDTCKKSGFPRKALKSFEGTRLNKGQHRSFTWNGYKCGGDYSIVHKQTWGLLTKYIGKPYDEFFSVYSKRMKFVKTIFGEFGYTGLEDYLYKNFIYSEDRPQMLRHAWKGWHLFRVDDNGIIRKHIMK